MCQLSPFTVLSVHQDSGQIISHHVSASNSSEAFVLVSKLSDLDHVACLVGWVKEGEGIEFPGHAIVNSETVLNQPEVFGGKGVSDFYIDDEYCPDPYWYDQVPSNVGEENSIEGINKAEFNYLEKGGRKV